MANTTQEGTLGGLVSKPPVKTFGAAIRLTVFLVPGFAAAQSEWLTWGYDQQRTGWNQSETVLTKANRNI